MIGFGLHGHLFPRCIRATVGLLIFFQVLVRPLSPENLSNNLTSEEVSKLCGLVSRPHGSSCFAFFPLLAEPADRPHGRNVSRLRCFRVSACVGIRQAQFEQMALLPELFNLCLKAPWPQIFHQFFWLASLVGDQNPPPWSLRGVGFIVSTQVGSIECARGWRSRPGVDVLSELGRAVSVETPQKNKKQWVVPV